MGLFQSEVSKHQDKLSEEYLYGSVADEIANNHVSPGLWAKAFAEADGDEKRAQAKYIKARVTLLKSEQSAVLEALGNFKELAGDSAVVVAPPLTPPKASSPPVYVSPGETAKFALKSLGLILLVPIAGALVVLPAFWAMSSIFR